MDVYALIAALVLLPILSSLLCIAIPQKQFRNPLVILVTLVMIAASAYLSVFVIRSNGQLTIKLSESSIQAIGWAIKALDVVVMLYVIIRGLSQKRYLSPILAVIQLVAILSFEMFGHITELATPLKIDYLSLILVLLASVIGPLILVFSMGYMDEHEHHLHLDKSKQPRFFFILFLFLGVMNGLAMADNLLWMYTFWEVTTLCSFLLISHDGGEVPTNNAYRTLDLNMLGGVAFAFAIILVNMTAKTISISEICTTWSLRGLGVPSLFFLAIALLCLAGMTKSAQFPFQSWLLGAMVAPTPVSALLHSSTMVKAGVFLIVRLSPVIAGTTLGGIVAFAGAFTFMAASAIAISQQNGKKVLAYSTIANLGLIICCAGIGSAAAVGAAILLMIYHAVSKGMLFLCVGAIEQQIGSRDIEDMQGLFKQMPFTTWVTVLGMISMLLPPFGVLMTKWIAIESAVNLPWVLLLIVVGSAFTVVFWAKWLGIILTASYKEKYPVEKLKPSIVTSLSVLLIGVFAASCGMIPMFNYLVSPQLTLLKASGLQISHDASGLVLNNGVGLISGDYSAIPLFAVLLVLIVAVPFFFLKAKPEKIRPPYFGGDLANNDIRGIEFYGPGDKVENIIVQNYYMTSIFGEQNLSIGLSLIATAVIVVMFGVAFK